MTDEELMAEGYKEMAEENLKFAEAIYGKKGDNEGLLDIKEEIKLLNESPDRFQMMWNTAVKQRDLTISIKDKECRELLRATVTQMRAECRERVKSIVEGMKAIFRFAYTDGDWKDGELENYLKEKELK